MLMEHTIMKALRIAVGLTVVNLVILVFVLLRARSIITPEVAPVLRGRAIRTVDTIVE